jgi:hypothetical protein
MSERKSRRAMYAHIALAESVPAPTDVRFSDDGETLSLSFATLADGLVWARHLGMKDASTYVNSNGHTYLHDVYGVWHGWTVNLWAVGRPDVPADVPDDARAMLERIAGDPS